MSASDALLSIREHRGAADRGVRLRAGGHPPDNAEPPPLWHDRVRLALDLDSKVPVVFCDARQRESCKAVLISAIELARSRQAADLARHR